MKPFVFVLQGRRYPEFHLITFFLKYGIKNTIVVDMDTSVTTPVGWSPGIFASVIECTYSFEARKKETWT